MDLAVSGDPESRETAPILRRSGDGSTEEIQSAKSPDLRMASRLGNGLITICD